MNLTINIAPELETQLRDEAARKGIDTADYIVNTLEERMRSVPTKSTRLTAAEAELLRKINEGISPQFWQRYHALIARRRGGTLTPDEQTELIACSDRIEQTNAQHIEYLVQLARLRGTTLPTLMQQLCILAPTYD